MTTTTSIIGSWWPSFDYDAGYRLCVSAASYRELATMIDEALNAEREACAKIVGECALEAVGISSSVERALWDAAARIRKRKP